jgi:hypothetical protein
MAIQTVEAWIHSVHRNFTDVIVFLVIGGVRLALLPVKREQSRKKLRERAQPPTLCADNHFLSRSFHDLPEGMTA